MKIAFLVIPAIYLAGLALSYYWYYAKYIIEPDYHYNFKMLTFDYYTLTSFLLAVVYSSILFKRRFQKPSDFFLFFYSTIVVLPYSVLHTQTGHIFLGNLLVLYLPLLSVYLFSGINFRLPAWRWIEVGRRIDEKKLIYAIAAITVVTIYFLLKKAPASASFSLSDIYTRRLDAREIYGSRTLLAYLSAIVMNGALPLFAFWGYRKRNLIIALLPVPLFSLFFYIYGVKSPIVYIVAAYLLSYFIEKFSIDSLLRAIFLGLTVLVAAVLLEIWINDYSYLQQYILRRAYYVTTNIIEIYFDFFHRYLDSPLTGFRYIPEGISIYVGAIFFKTSGVNANTNTFLYFLAQFGLIGYLAVTAFIGILFSIFDKLATTYTTFVFFSFMYAILILEQSATTALLSSGIGVLAILFYFTKPDVIIEPDKTSTAHD
ncbi:MAG: hypothetical protein LC101_06165 [Flavobacteriales bacterium]|nr:hypothetical protein [Flavobacteriales bacterium]